MVHGFMYDSYVPYTVECLFCVEKDHDGGIWVSGPDRSV